MKNFLQKTVMLKRFSLFIIFSLVLLAVCKAQPGKVISADGVEISFEVFGQSDTSLVFVHGWSCDKSYWKHQRELLSKKYSAVFIDLAGHGESGLQRNNYTIEKFGKDIEAVANHLRLKRIILIGHSMGGSVIIEAAKLLKGKVVGLIGVDTFQSFGDDWSSEQKENFLKPFKENFIESTKAFVKNMFPKGADSLLVINVANDMSSAPPSIAVSAMRNLFYYNPVPTLKEIDLPIITINCDLYPIAIDENKKLVKSFDVKIINGAGHFLMMENPKMFKRV